MSLRETKAQSLQEQLQGCSARSFSPVDQQDVPATGRAIAGDGERMALRADEKSQLVFFIRSGWRMIESEQGKPGILVGVKDQLPTVIDILIKAAQAGELDDQLNSRSLSSSNARRQ